METEHQPIQVQPEEEPIPSLSIPEYVDQLVRQAKAGSVRLASLSTAVKNHALMNMAEALETNVEEILAANEQDVEAFGSVPQNKAMADRLRLNQQRIADMASGLREVAKLPDPLG